MQSLYTQNKYPGRGKNAGFSFIELAVVIVIIGLLIGGILGGQSLLTSSKLKSIQGEAKAHNQAVLTFRSKYQALPGDMRNATSVWNAAHGTATTCRTTVSSAKTTCNGDGNGRISATNGTDDWERARMWQHLHNAGIMAERLPGNITVGNEATYDVNMPRSKYGKAGWTVAYMGYGDGTLVYLGAPMGRHSFIFGGETAGTWNVTPVLSASDAWAIDSKFDNGKPSSGSILAGRNAVAWAPATNCQTTDVANTADYNVTVSGVQCILIFQADF